jgi:hypothetical protein
MSEHGWNVIQVMICVTIVGKMLKVHPLNNWGFATAILSLEKAP